jgi:hypothetical protein
MQAMELNSLTPELPQLLIELGIQYDPERLADHLSSRWLQVYARAVRIAASLGGFIARVAQDYALGQLEARSADRCGWGWGTAAATLVGSHTQRVPDDPRACVYALLHRATELRKLLSGLGPAFVKVGQALSARPDLLPQVRPQQPVRRACCSWLQWRQGSAITDSSCSCNCCCPPPPFLL